MDNAFDVVPVDSSDPDYDFGVTDQKKKIVSNIYADRLFRVIGKVWDARTRDELIKSAVRTDYGVICKVKLSEMQHNNDLGVEELQVIFKDASLVRRGKRWSQILYMGLINYYIKENAKKNPGQCHPNTTFIMMTDGDTTFTGRSFNFLISGLKKDPTCAGVCGRIAPKGKSNGPIIMYEKFEYAAGHWFQKVAEHVMGSVLCCPGAFSCYRLEALNSVVKAAINRYDRSINRPIESIDSIDSIIFRSFEVFGNCSWRRCGSNGPKIVKIRAILAIFRPFENLCEF